MGTWAVEADGGGNTAGCTFSCLETGNSGTITWTVTNTGSIPAYVDMAVSVAPGGTGNLADSLLVHMYVSGYVGDIYGSDVSMLPISGAGGYYDLNLSLMGGGSLVIMLDWLVDGTYTPGESDEVVLTMHFNIQPSK